MEWIVVRFHSYSFVVERTIAEFRSIDVLHCGPSRCCLMPPRHTPFYILTHADTGGNSFHNSSAFTIYIRCKHSLFSGTLTPCTCLILPIFFKVEHETSAWGARIIVPALMIVATLAWGVFRHWMSQKWLR